MQSKSSSLRTWLLGYLLEYVMHMLNTCIASMQWLCTIIPHACIHIKKHNRSNRSETIKQKYSMSTHSSGITETTPGKCFGIITYPILAQYACIFNIYYCMKLPIMDYCRKWRRVAGTCCSEIWDCLTWEAVGQFLAMEIVYFTHWLISCVSTALEDIGMCNCDSLSATICRKRLR